MFEDMLKQLESLGQTTRRDSDLAGYCEVTNEANDIYNILIDMICIASEEDRQRINNILNASVQVMFSQDPDRFISSLMAAQMKETM